MKRNIIVGLLMALFVIALVACSLAVEDPVQATADALYMTEKAPVSAVTVKDAEVEETEETEGIAAITEVDAETEETNPVALAVALAVIVVVLALGNERITEGMVKAGLLNKPGQAATWQSVFGALSIAALALASYLGLEGQINAPLGQLVEVGSAFILLIPIFLQAGLAKLFHEFWKKVGWVTEINQFPKG